MPRLPTAKTIPDARSSSSPRTQLLGNLPSLHKRVGAGVVAMEAEAVVAPVAEEAAQADTVGHPVAVRPVAEVRAVDRAEAVERRLQARTRPSKRRYTE